MFGSGELINIIISINETTYIRITGLTSSLPEILDLLLHPWPTLHLPKFISNINYLGLHKSILGQHRITLGLRKIVSGLRKKNLGLLKIT
jgi:hypothetical protein